ncbi:MAG: DNA-processing protein DprA, partial [Thermoanaerobaculia bacterium]
GIVIVSGLARGIDAAAHAAALAAGGTTLAVLGTGIDLVYPPEHRRLRDRIAASGLLVTELADGTRPHRAQFPIRNRIIAGLSLGVLVVEAGERSGSLITARLANEGGREVFAVPGSIFSENSAGTHRLIQDGAKLVATTADVFAEIEALHSLRPDEVPRAPAVDADLAPVLDLFAADEPVGIEDAAERLGVAVQSLAPAVLRLELLGRLRALPGMRWVRTAD